VASRLCTFAVISRENRTAVQSAFLSSADRSATTPIDILPCLPETGKLAVSGLETLLLQGARAGMTETQRARHGAQASLPPADVTVLRMTDMHVRKIDNLMNFTALQELYLANNLIRKTENLQHFDLSVNLISSFAGQSRRIISFQESDYES
jgi:hypothetical protein